LIKVAVIEDHREFRDYLAALIGGTPGLHFTAGFRSMEEALNKIGTDLPDAVLVDIGLPGMSGVDGVRLLKERYPHLVLLMQTVYDDDERIFDALCAGASGYLLKKTPPARLLEGLKEAVAGGAPMSPEIACRVINLFREIRPPERADYDLTPHEVRILKLLVEGHNYKSAAAALHVSPSTINFHLQKIYEKLQVHSKSEAVAKALRQRLI
jgi:DNA-binding NarL/FixJ family response regulator